VTEADDRRQAAVPERVDQLIGGFLRRTFNISLRNLYSEMRRPMLDDVEHVPCNLCGADDSIAISDRDKYGLPVHTVMCRNCGLMYLSPRPTAASLTRFYSEGSRDDAVYHVALGLGGVEALLRRHFGDDFRMTDELRDKLRDYVREKFEAISGEEVGDRSDEEVARLLEESAQRREAEQFEAYANDLYAHLCGIVPRGSRVFEAGASWGKLLEPWRDRHDCDVTGLEPREAMVRKAKDELGITLIQGFPGTAPVPEDSFDLVMNIRTINHMADPLGDLRQAWKWLKPGGRLFIDISDAIRETHYEGLETNVIEIDHAYMFSHRTLEAMVRKAGFEIEKNEIVDVTRPSRHEGETTPPEAKQIRLIARKVLHEVAADWPGPVDELAGLLHGQLHRERAIREEVEQDRQRRKERREEKNRKQAKRAEAKLRARQEAERDWFGLRGAVAQVARRNGNGDIR
jgi:SAM-dependent methyltransferase